MSRAAGKIRRFFTRLLYNSVIAFFAVLIVFCVAYVGFMLGPAIETNFNPAVSKLTILKHEGDMNSTTILAEFTKIRNCKYLGISWTHVLPTGEYERVPVVLGRSPGDTSDPSRPVGLTIAGPWTLPLSWDEIMNHSFAQLYHQCQPFWVTVTNFYP